MRDHALSDSGKYWFCIGALGIIYSFWTYRDVFLLRLENSRLQSLLDKERRERLAERKGRIRAQKELRGQLLQTGGSYSIGVKDSYSLRPIGTMRSCFTTRNGTPRQPSLVPEARAVLNLRKDLQTDMTEGLSEYSHCWILYMFHKNTDLDKVLQSGGRQVKSKIRVPRLNGRKSGVFATRSPHRPCPIGLSVAQIHKIDGRQIILKGCDIVDGTPVLDLKPYVPFCDSVNNAIAPTWVDDQYALDPLTISTVSISACIREKLEQEWNHVNLAGLSVYSKADSVLQLILQVLRIDIRSVHQRLQEGANQTTGGHSVYELLVDHLRVKYVLNSPEEVTVIDVEREAVQDVDTD